MRLIGRNRLDQLRGSGEAVETWLTNWVAEIRGANWKHAADVVEQFPNVRRLGGEHFEFPIGGCGRVIQLVISFSQGVVLITDLKSNE